jgi:hypothetical protein
MPIRLSCVDTDFFVAVLDMTRSIFVVESMSLPAARRPQ